MVGVSLFSTPSTFFLQQHKHQLTDLSPSRFRSYATSSIKKFAKPSSYDENRITTLLGASGLAILTLVGPACGPESPLSVAQALQLNEPANALSLPTWAVHVSSVAEWVTAMALIWQYGEKSGNQSWKGLSWGMVPLLGGAFCACTWHFFYNSETLEILVAIQAALTVIGNITMCIAAFRIFKSSQEQCKNQ